MTSQGKTRVDLKQIIASMKEDMEASVGQALSNEVDNILDKLLGMSDLLDSHFSALKSRLDQLEENIINAIN